MTRRALLVRAMSNTVQICEPRRDGDGLRGFESDGTSVIALVMSCMVAAMLAHAALTASLNPPPGR